MRVLQRLCCSRNTQKRRQSRQDSTTVVSPWRSASSGMSGVGLGGLGSEMLGNENKAVFQPTQQNTYGVSLTDDTTPLATGEREGPLPNEC